MLCIIKDTQSNQINVLTVRKLLVQSLCSEREILCGLFLLLYMEAENIPVFHLVLLWCKIVKKGNVVFCSDLLTSYLS